MAVNNFQVFFDQNAYAINVARTRHLASLNLDLQGKKVLEVGAGVGLLTEFFEAHQCTILTTDARPENVAEIRREYPTRQAQVLDLDAIADITHLGSFDIIFCYGLLYHLKKPDHALKLLASVCSGMILLETCVSLGDELAINLTWEDQQNPNQAFSGTGCRPTRPWVMETLQKEFGHAYIAKHQPCHIDFDLDWHHASQTKLHRSVFVGSRVALENSQLLTVPIAQQQYEPTSQRVWIDAGNQPSQAFIQTAKTDACLQVYRLAESSTEAEIALPNYQAIAPSAQTSLSDQLSNLIDQSSIGRVDVLRLHDLSISEEMVQQLSDRLSKIDQLEIAINPTTIESFQRVKQWAEKGLFLVKRTIESPTLEFWHLARKNVIAFLPDIDQSINTLTVAEVLLLAQVMAVSRPIDLYPGWFFNIEWDAANPTVQVRRAIWTYFRNHSSVGEITWNWVANLNVNLRLGNDFSSQLFIAGCYEPNEFYFLSQILQAGMTFLDVGANDGLYALFAAKCVGEAGRVVAFEPSDREFNQLKANIQLNNLQTIQPLHIGLAEVAAERPFKLATNAHSGQNTLGDFVYDDVIAETVQTIALQTLDAVMQEQKIQRVDVIKVDIEGAEFAFLQGAETTLKTHHPLILLELLDDALLAQGSSSAAVLSFLKSSGYQIFSMSRFTGLPIKTNREMGLSPNIIAAHPSRSWPLLNDADQATQISAELEQADHQFAQVSAEACTLQTELTHCQQVLHQKQNELEQNQQLVQAFSNRIAAMESSKFWQIRSSWLRLKKNLGLSGLDE
jgi:FkbM family methyltransferase